MAKKITVNELAELPIVKYDKLRPFIKSGDIVFCSGGYLFSKIIQKLTKSTWSHVGIIYIDKELGRVLLLEAEPFIGNRLIPLSKYINDYKGKKRPYKGKICITRLNPEVENREINKGISFGLDELTRPYDNWEIFRIMLRILFKIGKREKNRSYICSELVRDVLKKAGILMELKDSYISPDNVWVDERIEFKHRIL